MSIENISSDILYECISRSGLCPLDSTGGDGSTFDIVIRVCLNKTYDHFITTVDMNLSLEEFNQQFKNEFINEFMILHHNIVVKQKHFNWNW